MAQFRAIEIFLKNNKIWWIFDHVYSVCCRNFDGEKKPIKIIVIDLEVQIDLLPWIAEGYYVIIIALW